MGGAVDGDRRWDELRESFSQAGTRPWERMLQIGAELLVEVGKDTNVLSYVALSLFQVRGYAGLAEAFECWTDLLTESWDRVWPEKAIRRKAGPLRFAQVISEWVKVSPPRAEVPQETIERCIAGLTRFEAALVQRLGDDAGPLDGVRETLEQALRALSGAQAVVKVVTTPPPTPPPTPLPTAPPAPPPALPVPAHDGALAGGGASALSPGPAPGGAPPTVSTPTAVARAPIPEGATPAQVVEAFRQLRPEVLTLVERARALDPGVPAPYRLGRSWAWMSAALPARDDQDLNRTRLEFVHQQTADKMRRLVEAQAWAEALVVAEKIWPRSLFWLDPHHVSSLALRGLGHEDAAAAVEEEVRALVGRLPALPGLRFADNTPLANDRTQAWLRSSGEVGSGAVDERTSSPLRHVVPASPAVVADATSLAPAPTAPGLDILVSCGEALRGGRPREAASQMEVHLRSIGSGREAFRVRVRFVHLLLDAGLTQAASPLLAALDEEASAHHLDRWEPELAADLVAALLRHRARPIGKPSPPEAEALRGRAARLGAYSLLFES